MSKEANMTGNRFEKTIEEIIQKKDYIKISKNRYNASKLVLSQKIYTSQLIIGKTIYETDRKCDFILYNPYTEHEIVIECKWQDVAGSVDEKYPFLVLNIKKIGIDTIIILDGNGYKKGAKRWLQSQVSGCLIGVMNFSEFSTKTRTKNLI